MSHPKRLLDSEPSALERELLESARDDCIGEPSRKRIWAGLAGIGAALPPMTGSAAGTGLASGAGSATGAAAATKVAGGVASWVAVGLVAAGVALGGGVYLSGSMDSSTVVHAGMPSLRARAVRSAPVRVSPKSVDSARPAPTAATLPEPHAVQRPIARPSEPGISVLSRRSSSPDTSASALPTKPPTEIAESTGALAQPPLDRQNGEKLVAEVQLLDSARRALRAGDAQRAQRSLDEHRKGHSSGALGPEAEVLRMELLLVQGRRGDAAAAALRFLREHPASTHTRRVRALHAAATTQ
jgi:hypothetical protein